MTESRIISDKTNVPYVVFIALVAAIGGFLFGYDSGCINGAVSALQQAFNASDIGSGFNVASMLLGCTAGAFLAGTLADRHGRRAVLVVSAILFSVSAVGSGAATGSAMFILFRLIGGFAVGSASIISPAYISEIAPAHLRGRLASLQQLAIVVGLFMAFLVNYLIAKNAGSASAVWLAGVTAWRWMFLAELVPATLFFALLFAIPESPRFLVKAGRLDQSKKVLTQIMGQSEASIRLREIENTLQESKTQGFQALFLSKGRLHPIVITGIAIAAFQQLVGINVVFYYGEVLWRSAGFSEGDALLINVIGGIINISATVVAIALIDRWGRKPLLMTGSIGMSLFLASMATAFILSEQQSSSGTLELSPISGVISLVSANLYVFSFGISWGPVMWVLLGEMFPNHLRGAALSIAGLVQWAANFTVTMTFPVLLNVLGLGGAYGIYTFFAVTSVLIVQYLVKETKDLTLEEMK